jgi:hypothetical protein
LAFSKDVSRTHSVSKKTVENQKAKRYFNFFHATPAKSRRGAVTLPNCLEKLNLNRNKKGGLTEVRPPLSENLAFNRWLRCLC